MAGVYLLLGPEKGLKEDHIKKIKADLGSCEVSKFYGFEDYESELFAQLNNNDLFADHKLVILEQAQEIKAKDKLKALAEYIKHPSDCATLVITSDDLFVAPEIMGAVPEKNTVKFYEMFESKKEEWLRTFFRKNSLSIDSAACTAIIEKVENNVHDKGRFICHCNVRLPPCNLFQTGFVSSDECEEGSWHGYQGLRGWKCLLHQILRWRPANFKAQGQRGL